MPENFEEVLAPTLYFDKHFQMQAAKILPGEYYATSRDMVLVTVLGSCVAACIRDRQSGVGGMNHFMLPESSQDADSMIGLPTRYGTYAMEMLINQVLKMGFRLSTGRSGRSTTTTNRRKSCRKPSARSTSAN